MIKYSQGEIIVDLTNEKTFDSGDELDVSGIMEDFFKENLNKLGIFDRKKIFRKKLIFIIKTADGYILRFEMSLLNDDSSQLEGYITNQFEDFVNCHILRLFAEDKTVTYDYSSVDIS